MNNEVNMSKYNKNLHKLIAALTLGGAIFSLAACGTNTGNTNNGGNSNGGETTEVNMFENYKTNNDIYTPSKSYFTQSSLKYDEADNKITGFTESDFEVGEHLRIQNIGFENEYKTVLDNVITDFNGLLSEAKVNCDFKSKPTTKYDYTGGYGSYKGFGIQLVDTLNDDNLLSSIQQSLGNPEYWATISIPRDKFTDIATNKQNYNVCYHAIQHEMLKALGFNHVISESSSTLAEELPRRVYTVKGMSPEDRRAFIGHFDKLETQEDITNAYNAEKAYAHNYYKELVDNNCTGVELENKVMQENQMVQFIFNLGDFGNGYIKCNTNYAGMWESYVELENGTTCSNFGNTFYYNLDDNENKQYIVFDGVKFGDQSTELCAQANKEGKGFTICANNFSGVSHKDEAVTVQEAYKMTSQNAANLISDEDELEM